MGTSVVAYGVIFSRSFIGFLKSRGGTPAGIASILLGYCPGPGSAAEPVQSFFTPELRFHPIQRSLPCQVRAHRCSGFATALRDGGDLFFHFLVADVDLFRRSDVVEEQLGFHILDGAVLLP